MKFRADRRERLDSFLVRVLPGHSRSKLQRHIATGGVRVDGKSCKPGFRLEIGMMVTVEPLTETPPHEGLKAAHVPFEVVYEDGYLLVVNKPAGIAVHPSPTSRAPTLVQGLLFRSFALSKTGGLHRPGIVHRLDKDTSGLMLVAKTDAVHHALQKAIQERKVTRLYRALVHGKPKQEKFTIRSFIGRHPKDRKKMAVISENVPGARLAVTHCRVVGSCTAQAFGDCAVRWGMQEAQISGPVSEIECMLETGRTHQVRVHLASMGLPIVGDRVYGVVFPGVTQMALRAARLEFEHPVTGERMSFST